MPGGHPQPLHRRSAPGTASPDRPSRRQRRPSARPAIACRGISRAAWGFGTWRMNALLISASTASSMSEVIRVAWSESSSTARPPGRNTRAKSSIAACGIVQVLQYALAPDHIHAAVRERQPTGPPVDELDARPARPPARRRSLRSRAFGSTPITRPPGLTSAPSSRAIVPVPLPTSTTTSPDRTSAAASAQSRSRRIGGAESCRSSNSTIRRTSSSAWADGWKVSPKRCAARRLIGAAWLIAPPGQVWMGSPWSAQA